MEQQTGMCCQQQHLLPATLILVKMYQVESWFPAAGAAAVVATVWVGQSVTCAAAGVAGPPHQEVGS